MTDLRNDKQAENSGILLGYLS